MNMTYYYGLTLLCVVGIIWGIRLMNSPKTAKQGNLLGAISLLAAIILTLYKNEILDFTLLWLGMIIGGLIGYFIAIKVTMLKIPQMVAFFNGLGGGASGFVAIMILTMTNPVGDISIFSIGTAVLALVVGGVTFSGSVVAALKLDQRISQRPVRLKGHSVIMASILVVLGLILVLALNASLDDRLLLTVLVTVLSLFLGTIFTIRVGGADMPITISLLNSMSGLAGAIAGFAIYDPLLIAVGGIVGAAGLILTQVMCKGMNRSLLQVLGGNTVVTSTSSGQAEVTEEESVIDKESLEYSADKVEDEDKRIKRIINEATNIVIVPGYGMALAQAQYQVKSLYDNLSDKGKDVKFAIHPVAGRMPGHMNVLLAEVDIPYEKLYELEAINEEFENVDLVIVVGANDVVNPAANTATDTPIYGMPILEVNVAKNVIICNWDTAPGYAGVPNTLYEMDKVILKLGDAKETVAALEAVLSDECHYEVSMEKVGEDKDGDPEDANTRIKRMIDEASNIVVVPGYGMALAQAQYQVKSLYDNLSDKGKDLKFAIHPVAGRMPGHMNVLLAEVDIPYDKLYELEAINDEFENVDLVIVVGANDVVNPAANTATDTPIYGMPILEVHRAKNVIICNWDTAPGYAGVPNTLYEMDKVMLRLGDAKETVAAMI